MGFRVHPFRYLSLGLGESRVVFRDTLGLDELRLGISRYAWLGRTQAWEIEVIRFDIRVFGRLGRKQACI